MRLRKVVETWQVQSEICVSLSIPLFPEVNSTNPCFDVCFNFHAYKSDFKNTEANYKPKWSPQNKSVKRSFEPVQNISTSFILVRNSSNEASLTRLVFTAQCRRRTCKRTSNLPYIIRSFDHLKVETHILYTNLHWVSDIFTIL